MQDGLKKGGVNVVFFDGITAGEKDFSTLVARLKKENIDFVYYGGYHPEMGQILRQSRAAGLKTQFMGPEGVANVSLSNIAGESAEGLLVTKPKNYDQVPANKPIVDAIKAKKQDPSGAFVWTTYAALQSLQAGLNHSDDPAEIAKYLKGATVDTVMGPLSWDEKGDLKGFEFGVFDWHANGTATDAKYWRLSRCRCVGYVIQPRSLTYVSSRDFITCRLPATRNSWKIARWFLSFLPACRPDKRQRHPAFF